MDRMLLDRLSYRPGEVKEREDLRSRNELEDRFENFLSAPLSGQPIVNDGDPE